jgi:hypothetical protein
VLELRRERKFELYGLGIRMPEPLVPAERRLEVEERTDAGGAVLQPVAAEAVVAAGACLMGWTVPASTRRVCQAGRRCSSAGRAANMQVAAIDLDIAKRVFQVHGADASGKSTLRQRIRRSQVLDVLRALEP